MKAKVLRRFKDKHNGKIYKKGDVITVNKERFAEICATDKTLVEEYKEEKKDEQPAE